MSEDRLNRPADIHPAGIQIARLDEIPEPGAREFTVGEGDWPLRGVLVRYRGEVHAFVNRCPHAGHALNLLPDRFFAPQGDLLVCASHGALFEPRSGECVAGPCAGRALQSLEIEVRAGEIFLLGAFSEPEPYRA